MKSLYSWATFFRSVVLKMVHLASIFLIFTSSSRADTVYNISPLNFLYSDIFSSPQRYSYEFFISPVPFDVGGFSMSSDKVFSVILGTNSVKSYWLYSGMHPNANMSIYNSMPIHKSLQVTVDIENGAGICTDDASDITRDYFISSNSVVTITSSKPDSSNLGISCFFFC